MANWTHRTLLELLFSNTKEKSQNHEPRSPSSVPNFIKSSESLIPPIINYHPDHQQKSRSENSKPSSLTNWLTRPNHQLSPRYRKSPSEESEEGRKHIFITIIILTVKVCINNPQRPSVICSNDSSVHSRQKFANIRVKVLSERVSQLTGVLRSSIIAGEFVTRSSSKSSFRLEDPLARPSYCDEEARKQTSSSF